MKKRMYLITVFTLISFTLMAARPMATSLTADYKTNPLGTGNPIPSLSWKIQSEVMNTMQESYEIRVALTEPDLVRGRNLIWKSGKVTSSQSTHVTYGGPPLQSYQRIYWQVRITDNHGKTSEWSPPARIEAGILDPAEWEALWIGPGWEEDLETSQPCPYLRKGFHASGELEKARLYISSRGLYLAEINGRRVGDQEFTPGWTSYGHRIQYQTYDVTDQVQKGENAIGIILGDGWYRGYIGWGGNRNQYGEDLSAIALLRITYQGGSVEVIPTDDTWKASTGPILRSDIYNGEFYDATMETEGWSSPGFDQTGWTPVAVMEEDKSVLIAPEGPPVRVVEEITPVSVEKRPEGWLVDMGQNMVGWVSISASGNRGDTLVVRHAEVLDKEGNMYYDNLRSADATNTFVLKGNGEREYQPHFTFQGFRYVMVSGYPGTLTLDKLRGKVVHSDMEPAGSFSCSSELINQLQHNIVWGLKGNFLDVPTDCPQRDERLGWTGDAQVFAPTACFNMNAATFYKKWLRDLAADQQENGAIGNVIPDVLGGGGATGWADAGVVIPWVVYQVYGDEDVLEDQYESMKKWIGYMETSAGEDYIWSENWHFGDWLSFDDRSPAYMGAYTGTDLIATAYFSHSASIVSRVAFILGKTDEAEKYHALSEKVKAAFNQEFVTPNGRLSSHTQTAYTLALAFGLLDEQTARKSAAYLASDVERFGHITTGFLGTPLISQMLTETGRTDLAYMLLNRTEYPSWLYPVTMGATTIWERWDGLKPDSTFQDEGMNSFNHYAYGAIGNWLYRVVAGINPDPFNPGYKHVIIRPVPGGGLTHAAASHESLYGTIASSWKVEGDRLSMHVDIPCNTSSTIHIPGQAADISVNGSLLEGSGLNYLLGEGFIALETGSGRYEIVTSTPVDEMD